MTRQRLYITDFGHLWNHSGSGPHLDRLDDSLRVGHAVLLYVPLPGVVCKQRLVNPGEEDVVPA